MNTEQKIAIMQAYIDGKVIEISMSDSEVWSEWSDKKEPEWDFGRINYRVKSIPVTLWVNYYSNGVVMAFESEREAIGAMLGFKPDYLIKRIQVKEVVQ